MSCCPFLNSKDSYSNASVSLSDFELTWVSDVAFGGSHKKTSHESSCFAGTFNVITKCCEIDVPQIAGLPFFQGYFCSGIAATHVALLAFVSQG